MCLALDFVFDGPDAYQLSVLVRTQSGGPVTPEGQLGKGKTSHKRSKRHAEDANLSNGGDNTPEKRRGITGKKAFSRLSSGFKRSNRLSTRRFRRRSYSHDRFNHRNRIQSDFATMVEPAYLVDSVLKIQGPHGRKAIKKAANFSTDGPFEVRNALSG